MLKLRPNLGLSTNLTPNLTSHNETTVALCFCRHLGDVTIPVGDLEVGHWIGIAQKKAAGRLLLVCILLAKGGSLPVRICE